MIIRSARTSRPMHAADMGPGLRERRPSKRSEDRT